MTPAPKPCPGCGSRVPEIEGPAHRYIGASPGCWAAYGRLLEREAEDFRYTSSHQLNVDAYCAQHPGEPSPQAIRSVAVHLVGLHLRLERGLPSEKLPAARKRIATLGKSGTLDLEWLERPSSPRWITVLDVLKAAGPDEHAESSLRWAESTWEAWSAHHATVRRWAGE